MWTEQNVTAERNDSLVDLFYSSSCSRVGTYNIYIVLNRIEVMQHLEGLDP